MKQDELCATNQPHPGHFKRQFPTGDGIGGWAIPGERNVKKTVGSSRGLLPIGGKTFDDRFPKKGGRPWSRSDRVMRARHAKAGAKKSFPRKGPGEKPATGKADQSAKECHIDKKRKFHASKTAAKEKKE